MAPSETTKGPRIALIGVGQVGGAAAYALILSSVASELVLVENNIELRDGQVRDLSDVAFVNNSSTRVKAGNYHEAGQCDIIVITAGSKHSLGQTTVQSTSRNVSIVRNIVNAMRPFRSDAILLVVSNPVDLLTTLAQELSRLPPSQVIGSGTFLDSARLRGLMADRIGIAANSLDVYVVGVHGEHQVAAWSRATVGGVPVDQTLSEEVLPSGTHEVSRAELEEECKTRSEGIIRAKGATPFGIGAIIASICSSILLDKRNVRPVSHFQQEFGCCVSGPAVLGRKGIVRAIKMPLDEDEARRVAESAARVKKQMGEIRGGL